jgi:hypothetical protein
LAPAATGAGAFTGGLIIVTGGNDGTTGGIVAVGEILALTLAVVTVNGTVSSLLGVCSGGAALGRFFALPPPTLFFPSSTPSLFPYPGLLNDTGRFRVKYDFLMGVETDPFAFSLFFSFSAFTSSSVVVT